MFSFEIKGSRNAVKGNYFKWRNGRIPYILSNEYTQENRSVIARAFEDIQNRTCIIFEPKRLLDFSYLSIFPGNGCASQVGKMGGAQMVSLGNACLRLGIIEHELMHVMGFWHEQSRADRDEYIRINWENVEKGMEGNFVKLTWDDIQSLGTLCFQFSLFKQNLRFKCIVIQYFNLFLQFIKLSKL